MELYRPYDKLPFPKRWVKGERPLHPALEGFRREFCLDGDIPDEAVRKAVATYYGMVTYLDRQAGVGLDALRECGLEDSTRIIYTDDHGDTVGDHGLFFKHSMYEGSVGVPLILAGPDLPGGTTVTQGASLIDVFPTVLECVGAEPKPEDAALPGRSLLPAARGAHVDERPVFSEYHAVGFEQGVFMLRQGDYKLIYYVGHEPQLFNLRRDPDEFEDLAADPEHQGKRLELERLLRGICDPEAVSARAKSEQRALLERHGGKEAALRREVISYSPVPEGSI
jgi:choline-sulfatase